MGAKHIKLTVLQKGYLKIFISNLIFFGISAVAFLLEQSLTQTQYGPVNLFFFPILFLYSIWYGFYSYKITKKILVPNACFFLFVYVFIFWLYAFSGFSNKPADFHSVLIRMPECVWVSGQFVVVSVVVSLITLAIIRIAKNNASPSL